MSTYIAPIRDMHFVIQELAGLEQVASLPGCEELSADLVDAILEEAHCCPEYFRSCEKPGWQWASPSTCGTPASLRFTRAPPPSRPTI